MHKRYICCLKCDEISKIEPPYRIGKYKCPVCGNTLFRYVPNMIERVFALNIASAVLFVFAVLYPIISFLVATGSSSIDIGSLVSRLVSNREWIVVVAVLTTVLIVPLIRVALYLTLFGPLYFGVVPPLAKYMLKILQEMKPWSMVDVFLVGILVSIVKLSSLGSVVPGISLWSLFLLVFVLAYSESIFDPHLVWDEIGKKADQNESNR